MRKVRRRKTAVNWITQLRKGMLEIVVLGFLRNEREKFGIAIIRELGDKYDFTVVEGTLYPLLSRMLHDGLLTVRIATGYPGHTRSYYSITEAGKMRLQEMAIECRKNYNLVIRILGNGDNERR